MQEKISQAPYIQPELTADTHRLDPLGDGISSLELVRISGSDMEIVNAARVSYGKTVTAMSDRDAGLIRFLLKHSHTSPFEHNQLSFRVKCPLYTARQWMRHRMASYNEISYRYVKAPLEFYVPPMWRRQAVHNKQATEAPFQDAQLTELYNEAVKFSTQVYEKLLENGVGRELARGILPVATYTEFIFTCNLHALMHFLKLRLHPGAQYEIMQYAKGMLELATPHFPVALQAWRDLNAVEIASAQDAYAAAQK
jgi:thymidylate synthase (FAD)